jgi:hypothetical protein
MSTLPPWGIGTRVRIVEDYTSPYPETVRLEGVITGVESLDFDGLKIDTPVITLDDGTVLKGYECWWTPIKGEN